MSTTDPTRRVLTEFGEPENFFGFTLDDLKLLIPGVFLGMYVVGNVPSQFETLGWGFAIGIVVGVLILIYASPDHQTTQSWLRDRLYFIRQPSVLTASTKHSRSQVDSAKTFAPDFDDERPGYERGLAERLGNRVNGPTYLRSSKELTAIDRFHVGHRAGGRPDGYVFGAVELHPANMALATRTDWEHAVNRFAGVVNSIEFPFQIYSTVTPVNPSRITEGYRRRLESRATTITPEFRGLLQAYYQRLPQEFSRRGTSIREFYLIVPVSILDVRREVNSVNDAGVLSKLETLPYFGGFVTTIRASRQKESPEEIEAKQIAELDHRLVTLEEVFSGLDGCSTRRLHSDDLAAILTDFWGSETRTSNDASVSLRTGPIVVGDTVGDRDGGDRGDAR